MKKKERKTWQCGKGRTKTVREAVYDRVSEKIDSISYYIKISFLKTYIFKYKRDI